MRDTVAVESVRCKSKVNSDAEFGEINRGHSCSQKIGDGATLVTFVASCY